MRKTSAFFEETSGTVAAEYGLLLAFIAIAIIASVTVFGGAVKNLFESAVTKFSP